jgi:hypothetical protein
MSAMAADEKKLLELFSGLDKEHRKTLLEFAEFLHSRSQPIEREIPEPTTIPRPQSESVVAAIKRLSRSYHMLDKSKILHETSALMGQHVMQGRAASEVIDELELIFERHYRSMTGKGEEK